MGVRVGDMIVIVAEVAAMLKNGCPVIRWDNWPEVTVPVDAIESIRTPRIEVGDRVLWREAGETEDRCGEVLALEPDKDNNCVWAWVRAEGRWPRMTMRTSQLRRA